MEVGSAGSRRVRAPGRRLPQRLFFQVEPAWSPDASQIAFSSARSGTLDLFVMNADGTGTRRLTSGKQDDSHPTWSSDGARLAFERDGDIYVIGADGSGLRRISDTTVEEREPSWSPDGTVDRIRRVARPEPPHESSG